MRVLAVAALGATGFFGVRVLADLTQNRPDGAQAGEATRIVLEIDARGGYDESVAAHGLVATCQQVIDNRTVETFDTLGDGRFSIVLEPSIGEQAEQRLTGCLEDLTIDRVLGDVLSVRSLDRHPR